MRPRERLDDFVRKPCTIFVVLASLVLGETRRREFVPGGVLSGGLHAGRLLGRFLCVEHNETTSLSPVRVHAGSLNFLEYSRCVAL